MTVERPLTKIRLLSPGRPNRATAIVGGEASGIVNWNDIRYPQFYDVYKTLLRNFWIPDEIPMTKDVKEWGTLSAREQEAYLRTIGLLSNLDSVQTRFILEAALFVSDPSVHAILSIIAQQEAVHNQSYSYVLSSIVPLDVQNRTFTRAHEDPAVIARNAFIVDLYENFRNERTALALAKSLVASIILEGLNFYSGFAFFYNLARNQKMLGTSTMISYIQRDEMQHSYFISLLLRAILTENPELDRNGEFTEFTLQTIGKAVELESNWTREVLKGLPGIDLEEMLGYVKYLANKRLSMLGLPDLYPGYTENVMPWIRAYSDENLNNIKTDFFEQKARAYSKVTDDNGFDEL
ncbi:ribonucleotide-diphosphate reductase subunit beta [Hydrogenibacillus schlegelii]|uniref:Ribonucleoside-diphosphate reductase subunit beta n=1 Tax=Hydrogenibacillus schlegelii TaxID=1484 RepID=A0A132MHC9_HYDSH|nr:ribonucleotide-diphosphate reductase subunit beta [Hydrogenibacillus schlegelii]KWW97238.1 ribonucleotide-diphosphate reductase subunit beta [Hydrogenibacillus schlegelii]OAR05252.1 ribonucleotide-diphosphate reductase subunit beta [Hydrogenibacillus schlegelii]PTQ53530.1 MAG: Ribonucleotide reductase of class Ia (aerobic), beta subunit [Hydrogenibacillus schlegelii]